MNEQGLSVYCAVGTPDGHVRCARNGLRCLCACHGPSGRPTPTPTETAAEGSENGEGRYPCPSCDLRFSSPGKLGMHKRYEHNAPAAHCDDCDRDFSALTGYRSHRRAHHGEGGFVCGTEGCDRSFASAAAVRLHRRSEHALRPTPAELSRPPDPMLAVSPDPTPITPDIPSVLAGRIRAALAEIDCPTCGRPLDPAVALGILAETE